MNAEDEEAARQERIRERAAKKKQEEMQDIAIAIGLGIVILILGAWGIVELLDFCRTSHRCGR